MNYQKEIRKLLVKREAQKFADVLAESISKSRVSTIEKLTDAEAQKLVTTLSTFTFETLVQSIYLSAFVLRVIKTKEVSEANDLAVIEYCIQTLKTDKSTYLLKKSALSELNYVQLFALTADLGTIYLQHLATKN